MGCENNTSNEDCGVGNGLGDGTSEAIANEGTLVEILDPLGPSLSHCLNSEAKGTGSKCT